MLHRHASPAVAGSYFLGAILGAVTTGLGLLLISGLASPIPHDMRGVAAIGLIAILFLHVLRIVCLDFLPQRRYQIPRETFTSDPRAAAFRFAFELGTGVRTYITSASPYALAVLLVLLPPPDLAGSALAALFAAVGYGLGRSLIVAIQSLRSAVAVEHPKQWLRIADIVTVGLALVAAIRFFAQY